MHRTVKKTLLLVLGITSVACSKIMFLFFDDPEGSNLLVVILMAATIYFVSLALYLYNPVTKNLLQSFSLNSLTGLRKVLIVLCIQILLTTIFYFCLR